MPDNLLMSQVQIIEKNLDQTTVVQMANAMNQLPMFKDAKYVSMYDHAKDVQDHTLSIPCSVALTRQEQDQVIEVIQSCY